jgi:hypothetical protein
MDEVYNAIFLCAGQWDAYRIMGLAGQTIEASEIRFHPSWSIYMHCESVSSVEFIRLGWFPCFWTGWRWCGYKKHFYVHMPGSVLEQGRDGWSCKRENEYRVGFHCWFFAFMWPCSRIKFCFLNRIHWLVNVCSDNVLIIKHTPRERTNNQRKSISAPRPEMSVRLQPPLLNFGPVCVFCCVIDGVYCVANERVCIRDHL